MLQYFTGLDAHYSHLGGVLKTALQSGVGDIMADIIYLVNNVISVQPK